MAFAVQGQYGTIVVSAVETIAAAMLVHCFMCGAAQLGTVVDAVDDMTVERLTGVMECNAL